MKTVYLSSTYKDLEAHRHAVYRALRKSRYEVTAMEDYVARDERMKDACLKDVERCDLYIGLVARRYGFVPPQDNAEGLSITNLEYRHARKGKPNTLVFLLDPDATWEDRFTDSETGENGGGKKVADFRDELGEYAAGNFVEPSDLAETVLASVQLEEAAARRRALPQKLGSAESLTMMSSAVPEIVESITRAIVDRDRADVLNINLGEGDRWWSNRPESWIPSRIRRRRRAGAFSPGRGVTPSR